MLEGAADGIKHMFTPEVIGSVDRLSCFIVTICIYHFTYCLKFTRFICGKKRKKKHLTSLTLDPDYKSSPKEVYKQKLRYSALPYMEEQQRSSHLILIEWLKT